MSHIFTGAHVSRQAINLGGIGGTQGQPSDLIKRAMQQREEREHNRKRDQAAARIQVFYKGRHDAARTRAALRSTFDGLVDAPHLDQAQLVLATRLIGLFFVDNNPGDLKRAGAWCRAVIGTAPGSSAKTPLLFALYASHAESWSVLTRQLSRILLGQAALHPSTPQAPLFLEITKRLCDPDSYIKWKVAARRGKSVIEYLLAHGFYAHLRTLLLAIPPANRAHPAIPATVALALLPFKAFPAPPSTPNEPLPPLRQQSLSDFTTVILTIPLLPQRVPLPSLTLLAGMPLEPILLRAESDPAVTKLELNAAIQLLASIVAFGGKRVATFSSGKVLRAYLVVCGSLLDRVPKALFVEKKPEDDEGKGKSRAIVQPVEEDDDDDDEVEVSDVAARVRAKVAAATKDADGDSRMAPSPSVTTPAPVPTVDPRTIAFLRSLPAHAHLTALLTLSTRFSATTRPSLAAFLVSLLTTFPASRDEVLNVIMFGSGTSGERGGGLLREIWRGIVRAGPLGKLLGARERGDRTAGIVSALRDQKLALEWPALVLLAELYSRCLLTLGDDEFYSQRNPLSLDEVVGLSGLLRNLAFALYWNDGALDTEGDRTVVGTRMARDGLRSLATTLLQQVHARDSRRSFTPEDHWLMTSQFDLDSFIQTAVFEDEKLEAEGDADEPGAQEGDDGATRPGAHARSNALTKRQMAFISPRLGVLNNIPFVIPFENRVAIFRQFIQNDRKRLGIEQHVFDRRRRHRAIVRRDHLSEDSFAHLNNLGAGLKSKIEIVFIDEHGLEETGIDGGGLFKELLTSLSKEAFDTDRGLWLETAEHELYPNPHSYAREPAQLQWYSFVGRILGKALYEGILVDARFSGFFLSKWLGRQSYLDDLATLDPELYNGLIFLKNYTGNVEADLSLNFTINDDDFDMSRTIELVPGGTDIAVTNENRIKYIYLTSNYRLNAQMAPQCGAFFSGLSEIIPERFLRMFNQAELRMLVGGVDQPIDLRDLRDNTVYGGWDGDEANDTIRDFWDVVEGFDKDERSRLVKFVTSCARPPLLGFSELNPRFAIRAAGADQTRLPTSSTCVNLLKLPTYKDKAVLAEKLRISINAGAGFDLS